MALFLTKATKSTLSKVAFYLLGAICVATSLQVWLHDPLGYILNFSEAQFRRFWEIRWWLLPHLIGGSVALILGPPQIWMNLHIKAPKLHKKIGYAYIGGILLAATTGLPVAIASEKIDVGFSLFIECLVWILTVVMALIAVKNRQFRAHKEWIIRSYILTFSFISFRYMIKMPLLNDLDFGNVVWASWVIPWIIAEAMFQWKHVKKKEKKKRNIDFTGLKTVK